MGGWRIGVSALDLDFGLQREPRFQILLEAFLGFQIRRDDDELAGAEKCV